MRELGTSIQHATIDGAMADYDMVHNLFLCTGAKRMEISIHKAKGELTKLISAAERGEKIVITRHGRPVVEIKPVSRVGGFDFSIDDPLRAACGLPRTPQPVGEAIDDAKLSLTVLGLTPGQTVDAKTETTKD